jgi:two-component system response regulator YesN
MKKTWFNRLLLSYFPILFITITMIIFVAVSIINEISVRETEKANQIFSRYVIDSMDTSLHGIEQMVLEEMGNNDDLKAFFEPNDSADQRLVNYAVSRELGKIVSDNPMIHSLYLYRNQDQTVISKSLIEKLDNFGDKAYILQSYQHPVSLQWSPVRNFSEYWTDSNQKVISLSKKALLPFGDQGLVVVNVRVDALLRIVDEMINGDITFMDIWSGTNEQVYPIHSSVKGNKLDVNASAEGEIKSRMHSEYIGWDFVSGLKVGKIYGWVSFISRMWLGIGVATILVSIFYIIYVTRRNYKPIELIMQQIHGFQNRHDSKGAGSDEFAFIGKVLGNLIDQSQVYEKQYQEDLLVRKKQFFLELIEGHHDVSLEHWHMQLSRFNVQSKFRRLAFAVIEIDHYAEFQKKYSSNDQNLLKFGITNVMNEFGTENGQHIWSEWVSGQRLAVLVISNEEDQAINDKWYTLLDKFRTWIMVNLKQSVTVGLGGVVDDISQIHSLFKASITALQYKMSLGTNQVISYIELQNTASNDTHTYVQLINAMIPDFRMMNPSWETRLEQFFDQVEEEVFKDVEVRYILNYLIRLFDGEMEGMPLETSRSWSEKVHPSMLDVLEKSETLGDIRPNMIHLLKELYAQYAAMRETNTHYELISKIRIYIEENYANPDLSLNHISDKFGVNGKYASQLFKEEFGMKFVDFLVNLRMEHAKIFLLQTNESINDIAAKVGYIYAISFGRTFKKVVGVTPGDYRKHMQP